MGKFLSRSDLEFLEQGNFDLTFHLALLAIYLDSTFLLDYRGVRHEAVGWHSAERKKGG